jgi:tRNA modification GTPase
LEAVTQTPDDPIVALATPLATSAIAVIRASGAGSLQILSRLTGRDLAAAEGHSLHRCVIRDGEEPVDEVLVSVFKAPRSYTGEDGVEISCHGGLPVIRRIMSLLARSGFRPAEPGEFTQRAFLNGKLDLTRAEAVNEIVRARTDTARALALRRLSGAVEKRIRAAREALLGLRAGLEVFLDYPDEDSGSRGVDRAALREAAGVLEGLTLTFRRGRIYQEGATAAIAGATNSGKSSLFNLLLRQERAIVSETHGTTRDYLEASLDVEGIPVRLFDTAGIRETADPLETEGIRRAQDVAASADLLLYMVDSRAGVSPSDAAFLASRPPADGGPPVIRVWNKVDLPGSPPPPSGFLPMSSLTGAGLEALQRAMAEAVLGTAPAHGGELLIDSERQRDLISGALASLWGGGRAGRRASPRRARRGHRGGP